MIRLTRLNHQEFVLNSDLIETIESNPDTVLTLSNNQKLVVLESADQIMDLVIAFRRRILEGFGRFAI